MEPTKYRLFRLRKDGNTQHLLDTTKASLGMMGRRYSKEFADPVIALVEHGDGKTERYRYERGHLIGRMN